MAVLASASAAHAQQRVRIAFANFNDEASFGMLVLQGMRAAAKKRPDLEVTFYDNKADVTRAVENARLVVTTKPSAFIEYSSVSAAANQQVARIVKAAGLPTVSVQSRVPDTGLFAVDNELAGYSGGKAVATAAKKRWPGDTPAVFLISLPEGGPVFLDRAKAARKGILEIFPNATISEESSKDDPRTASAITTSFLTRNPGKKVIIFSHLDSMGIAALTAARNSGREADVLISSTGGEAVVFTEIRRPNSAYVGTFSFFPDKWGAELLELAAKLARKENIPDTTRPTQQLFIDANNIDQYYPRP
ncbi:MAG: sugar transporter substrate-binding protein [Gammaproteobacteria bacterium]|nr:sugar transporter substrate-binding protein [Gammaproteobacteria bacterium]